MIKVRWSWRRGYSGTVKDEHLSQSSPFQVLKNCKNNGVCVEVNLTDHYGKTKSLTAQMISADFKSLRLQILSGPKYVQIHV